MGRREFGECPIVHFAVKLHVDQRQVKDSTCFRRSRFSKFGDFPPTAARTIPPAAALLPRRQGIAPRATTRETIGFCFQHRINGNLDRRPAPDSKKARAGRGPCPRAKIVLSSRRSSTATLSDRSKRWDAFTAARLDLEARPFISSSGSLASPIIPEPPPSISIAVHHRGPSALEAPVQLDVLGRQKQKSSEASRRAAARERLLQRMAAQASLQQFGLLRKLVFMIFLLLPAVSKRLFVSTFPYLNGLKNAARGPSIRAVAKP